MLYKYNLIRAVAVLFVIFGHYFALCRNYDSQIGLLYHFKIHGIAMGLFFTISGFLIFQSAVRSKTVYQFLRRRILRVIPSITAISIGFAVLWMVLKLLPLYTDFINNLISIIHPRYLVRAITLTGDLFGNVNIYTIDFWSLHTEFRFYLLIALVFVIVKNHTINAISIMTVTLITILMLLYFSGANTSFSYPMFNLFCILYIFFGVLIYLLDSQIISKTIFIILCISLYLTIVVLKQFLFGDGHLSWDSFAIDNYLFGVILAIIIILFGNNVKDNKIINYIADISYPLYLTHHFCILAFGFVGIILSFILSTLIHFVVEKPFIEYGKTYKLSILGSNIIK